MSKGRSLRLFLADGTPGGIITAEIMNWIGHVMVAPRSRLPDLIRRSESGRTGIYFLTGSDPDGTFKPLVYLGETDNVGKRLAQHNKDENKDFWDRVCVVTSKDQNLTKAHVRYLESRLIAIATEAGRAKLVNGTAPDYGLLPESDLADMEFFIEQVRIVLPVLGMEFLRDAPKLPTIPLVVTSAGVVVVSEAPVFELLKPRLPDLRAEAQEMEGDFVVLAGSLARADSPHSTNHYRRLRDALKSDGTLQPEAGHLRFTRNTAFRSPSAAAAVILDRNDNGRTSWCLKGTDKTYADWQEDQVAAVTPQGGES
ncbi:MAG: GIY-YIG nuclease family protein [Rhodospirillaceae bacterium]